MASEGGFVIVENIFIHLNYLSDFRLPICKVLNMNRFRVGRGWKNYNSLQPEIGANRGKFIKLSCDKFRGIHCAFDLALC